jgi:hypothetical protein
MPKPRDRREYVRVAVNLPDNAKLAAIDDPRAGWLYVTGLCYAGAELTDGHISPKIVERKAGVPAKWTQALIDEGLWHKPGHGCSTCPQPKAGTVVIHDFLEHQTSRAEREKARLDGEAAAAARWAKGAKNTAPPDAKGIPKSNAKGIPNGNALPSPEPNTEVEVEKEKNLKPLLTLVVRRLFGDARTTTTDDEIALWSEAAGNADLAVELKAWLIHNAGTDLRDPGAALLGWLRTAAKRAGARAPGCTGCLSGWMPDEHGQPSNQRCTTCRPNLRAVEAS